MAKSDLSWNDYIEIPLEPVLKQRLSNLMDSERQHEFLKRKSRRLSRCFGQKHRKTRFLDE